MLYFVRNRGGDLKSADFSGTYILWTWRLTYKSRKILRKQICVQCSCGSVYTTTYPYYLFINISGNLCSPNHWDMKYYCTDTNIILWIKTATDIEIYFNEKDVYIIPCVIAEGIVCFTNWDTFFFCIMVNWFFHFFCNIHKYRKIDKLLIGWNKEDQWIQRENGVAWA